MKNILIAISVIVGAVGLNAALAQDETMHHENHRHEMNMMDARTSLGLSAEMKQHQLSNMREHVAAIKSIAGLMAENRFSEASGIAHDKLGLTPEMQGMCDMFDNKDFRKLGIAFHKSGDDLGEALQTGNANVSLRAISRTMQFCVECHATYRQ